MHDRLHKVYTFLLSITSPVIRAMSVCMRTQISVIIRARETKFGMSLAINYTLI